MDLDSRSSGDEQRFDGGHRDGTYAHRHGGTVHATRVDGAATAAQVVDKSVAVSPLTAYAGWEERYSGKKASWTTILRPTTWKNVVTSPFRQAQ